MGGGPTWWPSVFFVNNIRKHLWFYGLWNNNELFHQFQFITDFQLYLEVCINVAGYWHFFTILHHLSKQERHWASTILCHLCTSRRLPAVAGAGCCCCWCRSCWRSRGAGPGAPRSWRRAPGSRTSPGCILAPGLLTIVPVCAWAVVEVWLGMQMWHTGQPRTWDPAPPHWLCLHLVTTGALLLLYCIYKV